jgi:hypothetical protein
VTTVNGYDQTSMAGAFKQRYGDNLVQFLPASTKLRNATKFDSSNREGDKFNQMVTLSHSGGFTYAGSSIIRTAYDLTAAIPAVSKNAFVQATEVIGTEVVAYGAAFAAQGNDAASFVNTQEYAVKNLVQGTAKRLEQMFWGGGSPAPDQATKVVQGAGIGCLDAHSGSSTTRVYTISSATWRPGVWGGSDTNTLDAVNITVSGGAFTSLAVINTNAALTITKINMVTRQVTVSGNATDLTNIDSAGDGNVVFYYRGAFGNQSIGVHQILGATAGATTLFGITLGTYSLWDPIAVDEGAAPMSFAMVLNACDNIAARGFDGKLTAYVAVNDWTDMMNDTAALRRADTSYRTGEFEQGSQSLKFHGQTGEIEIVPTLYVSSGFYYVLGLDNWSRKGSTEISFDLPNGMPMWVNLQSNAGYAIHDMAVEALFCQKPSHNLMGYNVSPSHTA